MAVQIESGTLSYEPQADWGRLPKEIELGEVVGVATDGDDNVYAFNRGPHPMIVFDSGGEFLTTWGEDTFKRPHGLQLSSAGGLFCTDEGDHTVRHCTLDGEVTLTLGQPGIPSEYQSGEPFHRCTHTAESPEGDIYVTDGYGNARVHKYSRGGEYLFSWGRPGAAPGEFNLPHNIVCDTTGLVYVADRENHRIQIFDGDGRFRAEWHNLHRPSALCLPGAAPGVVYVTEIGPYLAANHGWPNLGPRVSVLNASDGKVLSRLSREPSAGTEPGQLVSPHGIALDSQGDVYIADVAYTGWPSLFPGHATPPRLRTLHKWHCVKR